MWFKYIYFFGWMSYNIQSTMSCSVLFMTQKEFRFVSLSCIQWEGRMSPMVFPKKTRQLIATLCSFTFPHHETTFSSRLYASRSSERHCQVRSACQKRSRAHKRADAVNTRFWEKTGLVLSNAILFYCFIRSMSNLHMWCRTRQVLEDDFWWRADDVRNKKNKRIFGNPFFFLLNMRYD